MHRVDHLIIGAGPAGLQLAHEFQRDGHDYLVLDGADAVGSFLAKFPRHRTFISINKVYTGYDDPELRRRWDWNGLVCDDPRFEFRNYSKDYFPSGEDVVRYMQDFAEHYQLNIQLNTRVVRVHKEDGDFIVTDNQGRTYQTPNLIVATGVSKPYIPSIPGIEHAEDYSEMSIDPMDFCGQRVLILGKGNSAFETGDNLVATTALIHLVSPNPIDFAWRSHYVGHLRAVNNNLLDTYQLKSQNAILDAQVSKITKTDEGLLVEFTYQHANGEVEEILYDRILCCTGFQFDTSFCGGGIEPDTALNGKFPDMGFDWQSTNVDGLYYAGVITHRLDYKKKQSGFIHGFRYNAVCLAKLLAERYHGIAYPTDYVAPTAAGYADAILADVNRSSALWQQSGFMGSVVVPQSDDSALYYKDMPIEYVHKRFANERQYWIVKLDFNQARIDKEPNVFRIDRVHKHDLKNAHLSTAIHPVIYRCSFGRILAVHHVIEDLRSEWHEAEYHHKPLTEFVAESTAMPLTDKVKEDTPGSIPPTSRVVVRKSDMQVAKEHLPKEYEYAVGGE